MWKNNITQSLGLHYPIIQAPMLGVSTPEMAAAISNLGGLGSLAIGGLSPETTRQLIRRTKSLTDKPFAVNLFVHNIPAVNEDDIMAMKQLISKLAHNRGYHLDEQDLSGFHYYTYHDQLQLLVEENVSVISFTFGCLDNQSIQLFKSRGCILIGTATCTEEALILEQNGIDMIVAQGIEAGGHRGTFIEDLPLPQIGLHSLLSQIRRAVRLPCIAAGGINDASSIKAALLAGAGAVQIGTAFIGTSQSDAIPSYKLRLATARDTDTSLTKAFSGRWARGIRNELMMAIEHAGIPIPPYPVQNSLTAKLRKLAQQHNDIDFTNLWAGQNAAKSAAGTTEEVFLKLVTDYERLYN